MKNQVSDSSKEKHKIETMDKCELAKLENEQLEAKRLQRELDCAKNGDPTVGRLGD